MNSPLIRALRAAARSAIPSGAFLKRDRGDALFVTDAPRRYPSSDWASVFAGAGFDCAIEEGLAALSPDGGWLARLEDAFPEPPDALCADLLRFKGLAPDPESLRLFALGARIMDEGGRGEGYDRLLRQRAAVCLRLNRTDPEHSPRGGGLYACALLDHEMEA